MDGARQNAPPPEPPPEPPDEPPPKPPPKPLLFEEVGIDLVTPVLMLLFSEDRKMALFM